ncbi:MAG TPA: polysaccharide deacetylase family protein [Selenomonadales bacterium]|nr:polysaccharide deacetylase family protein [Selenomonadales bacterium]
MLYRKHFILYFAILLVLSAVWGYPALATYSEVPVLNYHQVNNEAHNSLTLSSSEFEDQMAYLAKSGYTSISPEQLVDYLQYGKELPPNPILITFDDGYEDNYRVAYPILRKYHFTATIFLITDFVGNNGRYLTWKQVREMRDNGFDFESHTLSHILLSNATDEEIRSQLVKSKEALEWRLGQKVEYLAYPGGAYDQQVVKLAKEAGYRAAFTIDLGRDAKYCNLFSLNRIPIFEGGHTFAHFWLRLKFTQTVSVLQNFKAFLRNKGAQFLADYIYVP